MPRVGVKVICPVCGQEGTLIRRVRRGEYADVEYYYVRHYTNGEKVEHGVTRFADKIEPYVKELKIMNTQKLLSFPGGDAYMVHFLMQLAPPHLVYVEVFGGGATLLTYKPRAKVEVYNDKNSRLVNLFMCVAERECAEKLIEMIKSSVVSRAVYDEAVKRESTPISIDKMPDAEEAFYTLYAKSWTYSGHAGGPFRAVAFNGTRKIPETYIWYNYIRRIKLLRRRLKYVVFENLDWRHVIRRYDKEYTWFYLDPPHHNTPYSEYYVAADVSKWTEKDFVELLDALKNIRGKFTLKYTWDEDVEREIAARGFKYVVVEYLSAETRRSLKHYIFAMNYAPQRPLRPAGYVRRIVKAVL